MIPTRNLSRRQTHFALAIILVAIFAGIGLLVTRQINTNQPGSPAPTVTPGQVSLEGTIVCLPHKDTSGPQTLECAIGLQTSSGDYYGLRNLEQEQLINGTVSVSTKVQVKGDVVAPSEDERYGVVGNISVQSIEVIAVSG